MSPTRVAVIAHQRKLDTDTAARLRAALEAEGLECSWTDIRKGSLATKATEKALKSGAQFVVACGGDGTVRATIDALAGGDVPLAVLPAGTANLFAGGLGLPTSPEDVAHTIRVGATRVIDTGRCNGQAFAVMAGTGLDAAMIEQADSDKERLGTLAYIRAGVSEARSRSPFATRVKTDGEVRFDGDASCVLVGNLGTLKGGLEAFPSASPDDGLLDVAIITAEGMREWGSLVWNSARGHVSNSPHVQFHQAKRISVRLAKRHRFELDGGTKGSDDRLKFEIVPRSLHVMIAA